MNASADLSDEEACRYARQTVLAEVGEQGQARLKSARVLIIGIGGLGCPAALYLAAAGIGTLGLMDADAVDLSNLQRQIIYTADDIGKPKVEAAGARLLAMNSHVDIRVHPEKFSAENAARILADYDVVLDGTDNFEAHYLINDACVMARKPLVWGNVERFAGQVGTVLPHQSACYRCLYPAAPPPGVAPACDELGVLGPMPGIIGTIQAMEVLKLILQIGEPLDGRVLRMDALSSGFKEIKMNNDPNCTSCGSHAHTKLTATETVCALPEVTADELRALMASAHPPTLIDVRNPDEHAASSIPGARLIPLPELANRLGELNSADDIILHCKLGGRSAKALNLLKSNGFTHVRHLRGGITAYQA